MPNPNPGPKSQRPPCALTIAGSDSGGGAGIQADLKTFTVLGVYGASVVTALTAQNTRGVEMVEAATPAMVRAQLDAVLSDLRPAAAKTGMLASAPIIEALAAGLDAHDFRALVVDPVMVSKHGHRLLEPEAEAAMIALMLPRALLATPNLPEAGVLAGMAAPADVAAMREAARAIHARGARHVLVKGGHLAGEELVDLFYDGRDFVELRDRRLPTPHTHGTGCTLSAAIAANLALGRPLLAAVEAARVYLRRAIETSRPVGGGINPVNHLWPIEAAER